MSRSWVNMCCGPLKGANIQERYNHFRKRNLITFLVFYVPYWVGLLTDGKPDAPIMLAFTIVSLVMGALIMFGIMVILLANTPTEQHRRILTVAVSVAFILPTILAMFVTINHLKAYHPEVMWRSISMLGAYITGTAIGLGSSVQSLPRALSQLGYDPSETMRLYVVAMYVGLSSRVAGYVIIVQIWSLVDTWSVGYIICWHLLYVTKSYRELRQRSTIPIYAAYIIIWCIAIIRYATLDETIQEVVIETLHLYLQITLRTTIIIAFIGYLTSTLARLVLLLLYLHSPNLSPADELETVELVRAPV